MELTKVYNEKIERDMWMLTQQSYTLDMVQKEDEKVKAKKIPRSRDQAAMESKKNLRQLGRFVWRQKQLEKRYG